MGLLQKTLYNCLDGAFFPYFSAYFWSKTLTFTLFLAIWGVYRGAWFSARNRTPLQ